MREYLQTFLQEFSYPQECTESLLCDYEKIKTSAEFSALVGEYDEKGTACDIEGALKMLPTIAEQVGVHAYSAVMLYYLCLTKRWKALCLEKGIDESIWKNSAKDLLYKALECKAVHGIWGTFVGYWFIRFFRLERFALGRLQFEWGPLGYAYSKNGVCFDENTTVLNVHIPRSGEPMLPESVHTSYAWAKSFFKEYFGLDIPAFICDSWLLFPKHREMLKEGSNIAAFMADYEIVESGEWDTYADLWRLFDCKVDGEPMEALPQDSSLRREYVALMRRGEKSGYGKGIYVYKE